MVEFQRISKEILTSLNYFERLLASTYEFNSSNKSKALSMI
jgi:hypothetical protein